MKWNDASRVGTFIHPDGSKERLTFGEMRERLLRAARGGTNECGERLWYPSRIWNNQEDR